MVKRTIKCWYKHDCGILRKMCKSSSATKAWQTFDALSDGQSRFHLFVIIGLRHFEPCADVFKWAQLDPLLAILQSLYSLASRHQKLTKSLMRSLSHVNFRSCSYCDSVCKFLYSFCMLAISRPTVSSATQRVSESLPNAYKFWNHFESDKCHIRW